MESGWCFDFFFSGLIPNFPSVFSSEPNSTTCVVSPSKFFASHLEWTLVFFGTGLMSLMLNVLFVVLFVCGVSKRWIRNRCWRWPLMAASAPPPSVVGLGSASVVGSTLRRVAAAAPVAETALSEEE